MKVTPLNTLFRGVFYYQVYFIVISKFNRRQKKL